jgi:TolB-like protein/Tfp pilus assembly protein PilF/class 3 adenylate cyclase
MSSEDESASRLEIAHVLFMDVVGYSTLLITEQTKVIAELTKVVRGSSRFCRAEAEGKLLRVPTGDGMVLVFFDDPQAPIECAVEIASAIKSNPHLPLRMGIHSGPVNQIIDVNDRSNVAGAGIDTAQRVMDCGDTGHILLTKRVADDLAPLPRWNPHLHELGEYEVKHGRKVSLVNFYTSEVGNPELPTKCIAEKKQTKPRVTLSDFMTSPVGVMMVILLIAALVTALIFFHYREQLRPAAPITGKSIAVLPFENLSHDPDNAYFADGIQEELLTRLSKIADLKVISRTSTQRYKSAPTNLPEIARQLGVVNILEGTVQKADDQVRVNVQLINAKDDSHLWADKFDRKLTDVFAVESEIAGKIANTLQAKLTTSEEERIAARPTNDSDAHQLYLRGRYFWGKQTGANLEKAIDYFNQAVARDPQYAAAYAGLSDCYSVLFFWTPNPTSSERSEFMQKARTAAEKALEIDGTLGEAHESLANILFLTEFNVAGAKHEYERALELNPNYAPAHQWFANTVLLTLGEIDRAIAESKRAVELDPFSPFINASLAYNYIMARRYSEAIAQARKTIELDPNYYLSHQDLAQALELSGHLDEAIAEYEKPHGPSHEPYVLAFRAHAYGIKGDRAKALQLLNAMKELARHQEVWPSGFALAYLGLGDKEQAMDWLERSYEQKEYEMMALLKLHPMLDPLRGEPRFERLIEKVFQ